MEASLDDVSTVPSALKDFPRTLTTTPPLKLLSSDISQLGTCYQLASFPVCPSLPLPFFLGICPVCGGMLRGEFSDLIFDINMGGRREASEL